MASRFDFERIAQAKRYQAINLGDNFVKDVSEDVGQAYVATIVAEGEPLVVESQKMQHGGVDVMNVGWVLDGVHPQFVGGPIAHAALQTTARHP